MKHRAIAIQLFKTSDHHFDGASEAGLVAGQCSMFATGVRITIRAAHEFLCTPFGLGDQSFGAGSLGKRLTLDEHAVDRR
ncbi:hypothetical protein BGV49_14440 [Burkholderia ubonensis]|nr:hypothetical protein BGV49_14440 [Burkholderia ubonensis]